jgi:hypothetical protein
MINFPSNIQFKCVGIKAPDIPLTLQIHNSYFELYTIGGHESLKKGMEMNES